MEGGGEGGGPSRRRDPTGWGARWDGGGAAGGYSGEAGCQVGDAAGGPARVAAGNQPIVMSEIDKRLIKSAINKSSAISQESSLSEKGGMRRINSALFRMRSPVCKLLRFIETLPKTS